MFRLEFLKNESSFTKFPNIVPIKLNRSKNALVAHCIRTDKFFVLNKKQNSEYWVYEERDSYNEIQIAVFKLTGELTLIDMLIYS